jgi:competence protein ComEC
VFASVVNFIAALIFSTVTVPLTLESQVLHGSFVSRSSSAIHVAVGSIALIERFITFLSWLALADTPIAASGVIGFAEGAMGIDASLAGQLRWLVILSMLAIVLCKPLTPAPSCFDLHALGVGQGLAVVVQSDKRTFLYDTGASFRDGVSSPTRLFCVSCVLRG